MIVGHFKSREVAHDAALAETGLFVDHRAQHDAGVQLALHQQIGVTLAHKADSIFGGFGDVGHVEDILGGDLGVKVLQRGVDRGLVADQQRADDALLAGVQHGFDGVLITGSGNGHARGVGLGLLLGDQLVKISVVHGNVSLLKIHCCFFVSFRYNHAIKYKI